MKTLQLANGDRLPILGLGTWKAEPGEVGQAVTTAVGLGYRHIDCAKIYGNEAEIGQALKKLLDDGQVRRDDLWVTSKLWNDAHLPERVLPTLQQTLTDLQLDHLDLYLMHWPLAFHPGVLYPESAADTIPLAELPLEATWQAMQELVSRGLCRHIGVANFTQKKLQALIAVGGQRPEVNQIELHPYLQQPSMLDFCRQEGILLTAYAPLGSAGRPEHLRPATEPVLLEDPVIGEIARELAVTPAQVLLQWGMARGTAVIPKSVKPQRLQENLAAADIELPPEAKARIDSLDRHRRYFSGQFWTFEETGYTLQTLWDGEA